MFRALALPLLVAIVSAGCLGGSADPAAQSACGPAWKITRSGADTMGGHPAGDEISWILRAEASPPPCPDQSITYTAVARVVPPPSGSECAVSAPAFRLVEKVGASTTDVVPTAQIDEASGAGSMRHTATIALDAASAFVVDLHVVFPTVESGLCHRPRIAEASVSYDYLLVKDWGKP